MFNKRFFIVLLVFIMSFSMLVNADTTIIKDMNQSSSYARSSIEYLVQQNVIKGDQNGNYNPQKTVTRAEMVALLARVFELDTTPTVDIATFKDVPKENWANPYVEAAYKAGIVTGVSADEFMPSTQITREQMAVMFVRALKLIDKDANIELKNLSFFSDGSKVSSWAKKEVEVALEVQLMNGMSSQYFEPKKYAKKEQAAVVVERLMKNKESIAEAFKLPSVDENAVKLIVNGEAVVLKNAPIVKDGSLYLPVEFFNRYITATYDSLYSEKAPEVKFVLSELYHQKGIDYLWFQVDNKNAFINYEPYPFGTMDINRDKPIELKQSPISVNGFMYLPLGDLSQILGMEYNYSEAANTLSINDVTIGESADLYYALKNLAYTDYIGEIRARSKTEFIDPNNNYHSVDSFDMRDRMVENYEGEFYTRYIYQENNDQPQIVDNYEIKINDGLYTMDYSDNKWVKKIISPYATYIAVSLYNPIYKDSDITQRNMNRVIFDNIQKMDIKNAGTVNISGINTTKYVVELDLNSIKNTMTEEEYAALRPGLEGDLRGDFRYIHEYYVAKDRVIKQTYTFIGEFKDIETNDPIDIKSFTEMYYNKLPRDYKVIQPAAAQVKAVTN